MQDQGPTLAFEHKWNLTSKLDKLRLSSWLVTLASGRSSNYLTSDSLSSQLVKSTCVVTPIKWHRQALLRTLQKRYWGGGYGHGHAKKMVKIDHFLIFWKIFGENDILEIILRGSPPWEATLRLGSVAAALVYSPQQSADSTWGETCLSLWTVCSCLYIPMFY